MKFGLVIFWDGSIAAILCLWLLLGKMSGDFVSSCAEPLPERNRSAVQVQPALETWIAFAHVVPGIAAPSRS